MKTKKQKLIKIIVATIEEQHQLNNTQLTTVQHFINKRLASHGCKGYLFQTVVDYKRQYIKAENNMDQVAKYVVENIFI